MTSGSRMLCFVIAALITDGLLHPAPQAQTCYGCNSNEKPGPGNVSIGTGTERERKRRTNKRRSSPYLLPRRIRLGAPGGGVWKKGPRPFARWPVSPMQANVGSCIAHFVRTLLGSSCMMNHDGGLDDQANGTRSSGADLICEVAFWPTFQLSGHVSQDADARKHREKRYLPKVPNGPPDRTGTRVGKER